jgi:hypothetical protein
MLKNIVVNWYGEITLKLLKEKLIKFIRIKTIHVFHLCTHGTQKF